MGLFYFRNKEQKPTETYLNKIQTNIHFLPQLFLISEYQQISRLTTNQHLVQFTTKYSGYKPEDVMKLATIPPYTSYSSNKSVISNYQNIPQTSHNTQRISRNCNINSTKNVVVQPDNTHNCTNGKMNYNNIPEFSYSPCNSKPVPNFQSVTKLPIHRENISVPRPNYKEMINQVHNMKKTMTERELNMKIIERTLLSTNARPLLSHENHFNSKVPDSLRSSHMVSFHVPLDLSTKSVKTTADSTDCVLEPRTITSGTLHLKNETIYSAPKLDFVPKVSQSAGKLLNQEIPNAAINLSTGSNFIRISMNDSTSSRIRTKGELKVFNPNSTKISQNSEAVIKQNDDFYGLEKEVRNINLFDWDNMCNKLLKQLKASTFQQPNCVEKRNSVASKNISKNWLLRRKHRRVLYNQRRLQNKESNSSDDETFDTLKLKRIESFRSWRSKKHNHFKSKNNNNVNKINHNLPYISYGSKTEPTPLISEEEYKESDNESMHNSSDINSSISEKLTSKKEKSSQKKTSKVAGMITRSKSLITKKNFNLRKRFNHNPSKDKKTKKAVNRNVLCKKMVINNNYRQITGSYNSFNIFFSLCPP